MTKKITCTFRGIVAADLHIDSARPRCRTDEDWEATQEKQLAFLIAECNRRKCDLYIVGDLFDRPTVSSRVLCMVIKVFSLMKGKIHILAGNHDLPYHSYKNIDQSSLGVLYSIASMSNVIVEGMFPYSWAHFDGILTDVALEDLSVAFKHVLTFKSIKDIPPNCEALTPDDLFTIFPDAKWIFTGDMHKGFHVEKKGRHVVNIGCFNRQSADFAEYVPHVVFVDAEKDQYTEIEIADDDLVDDSYLKTESEREDRISAFVQGVKLSGKISLDFIKNINNAMGKSKLPKGVADVVNEIIGDTDGHESF